jgi:hypothetical protein
MGEFCIAELEPRLLTTSNGYKGLTINFGILELSRRDMIIEE